MNLYDDKLGKLENKIEQVRRRKIADCGQSSFEYIDSGSNIEKLKIYNNNIIEARRGCGKTSLILKAIEKSEDTTVQCDCQLLRKTDKDLIILEILLNVILAMSQSLNEKEYADFCRLYETSTKGIGGFFKRLFRKVSEEDSQKYYRYKAFLELLDTFTMVINTIKAMPTEQLKKCTLKKSISDKKTQQASLINNKKAKFLGESAISLRYKEIGAKLLSDFSYSTEQQEDYSEEYCVSEEIGQLQEQELTIRRIDKINELKKTMVTLLTEYKEQFQKGVMVYLDDFYQITKNDHPYIIQYLHDIYKVTKSGTFCFKVVTLPASLKINYDNEVVFSVKDDFSSVYLDYDLSNLDKVQEHLTEILIALDSGLNVVKSDISSLFTNDDTFKFLVIATGGIPRDFMTSFCEAVRISKRDAKQRIGKDQIYEVIKNLKTDKDSNIEIDSELPTEKIENAIEVINTEIIANMKTNVILYPVEKAEQHERVLRNLTNLRYLHLIKAKTTSERTKQECRAYLVDMTFYACGRIPSSFDFCRFWEMDDASRLNNLRRSPVWSFPEDRVHEILS